MWKREMNCLLSVCDYILEFSPTLQHRMMMEELWLNRIYWRASGRLSSGNAKQGSMSGSLSSGRSGSFRRVVQAQLQRNKEKWWLPVPCVVPEGLTEKCQKHLRQKRDSANQIHKAAMAINSGILAEMQIPESYMASLPKVGSLNLGNSHFWTAFPCEKTDHLLDTLNISSEHEALELADMVEASMHTWRRKMCMAHSKFSWDMVKDLVSDIDRSDKNHLLADRAEILLFCLKQRYPELSQTPLDTSKIQYNKDGGQAVLESYSRVLEGLAFNIVALIDDVLFR